MAEDGPDTSNFFKISWTNVYMLPYNTRVWSLNGPGMVRDDKREFDSWRKESRHRPGGVE